MIGAIREFIEEAQRRVKSKYTPSRERARWMNLAGKLIWYKDQILRSMSYEALEKDMALLKKRVEERDAFPPRPPSQSIPRRTIRTLGQAKRPNQHASNRKSPKSTLFKKTSP